MKKARNKKYAGFSLIELTVSVAVMLLLLGIVSTLLARSMGVRAREGRKADALASAKAAIDVMSREIGNAGFGIFEDGITRRASNGILLTDSNNKRIHFRTNFDNVGPRGAAAGTTVLSTNRAGEDVTYFFDATTQSIVRYDPYGSIQTSVVVNRISDVEFTYYNYAPNSSSFTTSTVPTSNTSRIRITVTVRLEPVPGQPHSQQVRFTSDVNLRNSYYMLNQY